MTRIKPELLLVTTLVLALLPGLAAAGPVPRQARVDPHVWDTIQAEGTAEVLVVLREQADLRGAAVLTDREARGRYVTAALQAAAAAGQRSLRAVLDTQRTPYQAFYVVNAIKLRADSALLRSLAARPDIDRIVANPWVPMTSEQPAASMAGARSVIARSDSDEAIPDSAEGDRFAPLLAEPGHSERAPASEESLLAHPRSFAGAQDDDRGAASSEPAQWLAAGTTAGVEPNLVRVRADEVWALGYTGQGIVVAGQDTGYDWDHPALINQYRGWDGFTADHDYNWHDAIHSGGGVCGADSPEPCDDYGHGTHTMGTIVGDDGLNRVGMAPGAEWIGCRNMDQGVGSPATYLECFEFFLAPYPAGGTPLQGDPARAPDVVNNSWSCPPSEGCDADTLEAAVEALRQAGIVVVVSAGNSGSACSTVTSPPAIYRQSLSVGAFSHLTDEIASFSSRGPVSYGGETYIKPDITAPGVTIRSSVPGGGYAYSQGTSMATPHVAGAVALLLSAAPAYAGRVDAIAQIFATSAEPRTTTQGCGGDGPGDVPNNVWGWGILDSLAAVRSVTGRLAGTVVDTEHSLPVPGARVTVDLLPGPLATTGATGSYTLTLATGTYTVTAQATGYFSATIPDIAVISGQIATVDFPLEPQPRWTVYLPLFLLASSQESP